MFYLISIINFYYVINKLIILIADSHYFVLTYYLKYLLIGTSLFLTIKSTYRAMCNTVSRPVTGLEKANPSHQLVRRSYNGRSPVFKICANCEPSYW
jgi:hypothetical protein